MLRPEVASCFRVEIAEPDAIVLLAAGRERIFRGRVYPLLAPLLDGSRTTEEIVDSLERQCHPAEVYFALDTMERDGLLVETGSANSATSAYWSGLGLQPTQAVEGLRSTAIRIVALCDVPTTVLAESLVSTGIPLVSGAADLDVVVAGDHLDPRLAPINRAALASGQRWLLTCPVGAVALVGPEFVPGQTGCWECLAQRLRHQRPLSCFVETREGAFPVAPTAGSPATIGAALHMAAALVTQSLAGHSTDLRAAVYSLDFADWSAARHLFVRRPQCAACGSDGPRCVGRPEWLGAARKGRAGVAPDETLARYMHHVSPVTGIVSQLTALPSIDGVNQVYMAGRNFALPTGDLPTLRHGLRSHSSGKGPTDGDARASALCEALERYCGIFQGDEPRRSRALQDLAGAAVHPASLLLYSEAQHRDRASWNAGGSSFCRVPSSFDEDDVIEWTPAWSITHDRVRYLPTAYCYYGYRPDGGARLCLADSNGCAAGNTTAEAIVQGLLELVERDAVAIWWYNRLPVPRLDLAGAADPQLARIAAGYSARGREVWALDLTNDLGLPVYAAVSRRAQTEAENILFGFGCHLDRAAALRRALAELNQILARATSTGLDRADAREFGSEDFRSWWVGATVADHPYLRGEGVAPSVPSAVVMDRLGSDEDIQRCRSTVERAGMEIIVLDQTRADVGLPVVRVAVPGMRHFWPRFAPGRLYDVPVAMGTLRVPTSESALNRVAMFL